LGKGDLQIEDSKHASEGLADVRVVQRHSHLFKLFQNFQTVIPAKAGI
jgi:hypothetical protein